MEKTFSWVNETAWIEQLPDSALVAMIEAQRLGHAIAQDRSESYPASRNAFDSSCGEIYRRYNHRMDAYLRRAFHLQFDEREDIISIVFIDFFNACEVSKLNSGRSVISFLFKDCRRKAIDEIRKKTTSKRSMQYKLPTTLIQGGIRVNGQVYSLDEPKELTDQSCSKTGKGRKIAPGLLIQDPEDYQTRREKTERLVLLDQLTANLPALQRYIIRSTCDDGRTLEQIAEAINTPIGTIKSARQTAVENLRNGFTNKGYSIPEWATLSKKELKLRRLREIQKAR